MMPAAKHFDPVLGIDIHIVQPPGPVPPVPIPHPFVGFLIDPFDYVPILGATVMVNGICRAQAGTAGKAVPSHIPIGGMFVKPPANECEMFMGSSTVEVDGDAFSHLALPALSCQDIGMPPLPRMNPKKKSKMKSLVLPTSVVLPIPAGPPVLVGGPPTISLMALGMKVGMGALGRGFKRLKKLKAVKRLVKKFKKVKKKAFKNMKPGFLKCKVLKAEPVDVRTGEVVVEQQDFVLTWPLPLPWTRHYRSGRTRAGVCGYGWETPADARLELQDDGWVLFHDGTGVVTWFPGLPATAEPVYELMDGARIERVGSKLIARLKSGESYHFTAASLGAQEAMVERITDCCNHELVFVRGAKGLREIRSDVGPWVAVESSEGRIERMTLFHPDHPGPHALVRYEYDSVGNLRLVIDALEHGYRFHYRGHLLVQHTNRTGLSFYYRYDQYTSEGRVIAAWGDDGLYSYSFEYDAELGCTIISDSVGAATTVELDDAGLPVREIDPLGGATTYEYDDAGRCSGVVSPLGARTEYIYDTHGNLRACVRADGTRVECDWDERDLLVAVRDPRGAVWRQEWDARGLLRAKIDPLGNAHRFEYDDAGLLRAELDARGAMVRYKRDRWMRIVRCIDRLGRETAYEYDALDEVVALVQPSGLRMEVERDAKGRLRRLHTPSGSVHELVYDGEDNVVLERDAEGFVVRYEYFGLGEVARRIEPDGTSWSYEYDREERLVAVTDALGRRTVLELDALGRVTREGDPWSCITDYVYDAEGRVAKAIDPLGRRTVFSHDALGRLVRSVAEDGTSLEYTYDPNGNLVGAHSAGYDVQRRYDARNLLVEESQGQFWIRSSFDANGNRVYRESSFGNIVEFEYDDEDEIAVVVINGRPCIRYTRDHVGRLQNEVFAGSCRRDVTHDPDGQLASAKLTCDASTMSHVAYRYDRRGCLSRRSDGAHFVEELARDAIGRVRSVQDSTGATWVARLDAAGSLLADVEVRGGSPWVRFASGGGVHYAFDAAGNAVERRSGDKVQRLAWDAENRLVTVAAVPGGVTRFRYDALGRRTEKLCEREGVRFGWDDELLSLEEEKGGARREIIYAPDGFEPLAVVLNGERVLFFQPEPNGAPFQLFDERGRVLWACRYSPTGWATTLHGDADDPYLRLQGQYLDRETGLAYNGERYFDPVVALFLSQDPIGLDGGDDPYEYGLSIWEWIDPLGLNCKPKRRQVFRNFPTRSRARNARPRPKPHKPKAKRKRGTPLTRQDKNKVGTGNNPDKIHKPGEDPHYHDDAHLDPDKPNVHYSYPK